MTELLLSNVNYAQGPKNPPAAKKKLTEIAEANGPQPSEDGCSGL